MKLTSFRAIVASVILVIASACGGFYVGCKQKPVEQQTQVSQFTDIKELAKGEKDIHIKVIETGTPTVQSGENVDIKSTKAISRNASWFGQGAGEVLAKNQGIQTENFGQNTNSGQSKGYGVLESFWDWIKGVFWSIFMFLVFGLIILGVLLFIPATAPVAGGILRFFASLLPGIGSLVEKGISVMKHEKPLANIVDGDEGFQESIKSMVFVSDAIINQQIREMVQKAFDDAHLKAHDAATNARVSEIKKTL